jgi:hypothetical protein
MPLPDHVRACDVLVQPHDLQTYDRLKDLADE